MSDWCKGISKSNTMLKKPIDIKVVDPTKPKQVQPNDVPDQMLYLEKYKPQLNKFLKLNDLKLLKAEESLGQVKNDFKMKMSKVEAQCK